MEWWQKDNTLLLILEKEAKKLKVAKASAPAPKLKAYKQSGVENWKVHKSESVYWQVISHLAYWFVCQKFMFMFWKYDLMFCLWALYSSSRPEDSSSADSKLQEKKAYILYCEKQIWGELI